MNSEEIFNHCSIYDNLEEFLKFNNMDKDEFNNNLTDGWYLDCTCGTYNGASDTFSPWDINPENVAESLVDTFNDMGWEDSLMELEGWNDNTETTREDILDYLANYNIFIIKDAKRIYIDMN